MCKRTLVSVIALSLLLLLMTAPGKVQAAKGPDTEFGQSSISVYKVPVETYLIFSTDPFALYYQGLSEVDGVSYDLESNTLTLKNCKYPDCTLMISAMGEDFKINLIGKNEFFRLQSYNHSYETGFEIIGTGSLTLGGKLESVWNETTISIDNNSNPGKFVVAESATLKVYPGSSGNSLVITENSVSDAVIFKGNDSATNSVECSENEVKKKIGSTGYALMEVYPATSKDKSDTADYGVGTFTFWATNQEEVAVFKLEADESSNSLGILAHVLTEGINNDQLVSVDNFDYDKSKTIEVYRDVSPYNNSVLYTKDGKYYTCFYSFERTGYDAFELVEYDENDSYPYSKGILLDVDALSFISECEEVIDHIAYDYCYAGNLTIKGNGLSLSLKSDTATYTGKAIKPQVVVKNAKGTTIKAKGNYTVTYTNLKTGKVVKTPKAVGKYKVEVTMQGKYSGTLSTTFEIKKKSK